MILPMPSWMPLIFKRGLLPLSLLLAVSGCGITDWFGEAEAPPLPGQRIAILAYERGLRADPTISEVVVQLPEPYVNADWAQPGGSAAHAMYHLSLSANPRRVWSADVGEGSGDVAQILAEPVVVGDTVYTMDSRSLVSAFAADIGSRRWQVDLETGTRSSSRPALPASSRWMPPPARRCGSTRRPRRCAAPRW